jgi:spermidine synthase
MASVPSGSRRRVAVLGALATAFVFSLRPELDPRLFAGGVHMQSPKQHALLAELGPEMRMIGSELLYAAEGPVTTVLVEKRWGTRTFFVGGRPEASDIPMDMRNQYLLAHLPALLHGHPRASLVIGLGSGMTAGCLSLHGQVDVAELSPEVRRAAATFADLNHDVTRNPRVHIIFEDGRTYLATRKKRYDVITVDPIHPYVAGASTLYTADYFESLRKRLAPGGIAAHWLPLYQLEWRDVAGVLRSFQHAFPDAMVYLAGYDAILIGGAGPALPPAERLRWGFEAEDVRADLRRVYIDSPELLAATASVPAAELRALVGAGPLLTDDHTWIEFTAPKMAMTRVSVVLPKLIRARVAARAGATGDELLARSAFDATLRAIDDTQQGAAGGFSRLEAAARRFPDNRELRDRLNDMRASGLSTALR